MREDFVTQLRVQLREAAEREERRGPIRRVVRGARSNGGSPPVIAAAAVLLLALLTVAAGMALRRDDPAPAGRDLRVVARTPLVAQGGSMVPGFGAVWVADGAGGEVLRVDPRTRKVTARIDVGGEPLVNIGNGAVWASIPRGLVRIDPESARVTARIELPLPEREVVIPGGRFMWTITPFQMRRLDPRRDVFDRRVRLARASFQVSGLAYDADAIYVQRADGVLLTFDATSGARLAMARPQYPGNPLAAGGGTVFAAVDNGVAAVDGRRGETLWVKNIGTSRVNGAVLAGTSVWVHGTDLLSGRDRVWRIDAGSGAVEDSLTLPEFGLGAMAPVGDQIWVLSEGGELLVVGDS